MKNLEDPRPRGPAKSTDVSAVGTGIRSMRWIDARGSAQYQTRAKPEQCQRQPAEICGCRSAVPPCPMHDEWWAPWLKSVSCPPSNDPSLPLHARGCSPIAPKAASRSAPAHAIKRRPASASTSCRACWFWMSSGFGADRRSDGTPLGGRSDQAEAPKGRLIGAHSWPGRDGTAVVLHR